jgi:hypothetical protein
MLLGCIPGSEFVLQWVSLPTNIGSKNTTLGKAYGTKSWAIGNMLGEQIGKFGNLMGPRWELNENTLGTWHELKSSKNPTHTLLPNLPKTPKKQLGLLGECCTSSFAQHFYFITNFGLSSWQGYELYRAGKICCQNLLCSSLLRSLYWSLLLVPCPLLSPLPFLPSLHLSQ